VQHTHTQSDESVIFSHFVV